MRIFSISLVLAMTGVLLTEICNEDGPSRRESIAAFEEQVIRQAVPGRAAVLVAAAPLAHVGPRVDVSQFGHDLDQLVDQSLRQPSQRRRLGLLQDREGRLH